MHFNEQQKHCLRELFSESYGLGIEGTSFCPYPLLKKDLLQPVARTIANTVLEIVFAMEQSPIPEIFHSGSIHCSHFEDWGLKK